MAQTPLNEQWHDGGFLVSEANGHRSRERVTVVGQKLNAGTVLGKKTLAGTATAVAGANTGNGIIGAITVGASAIPGVYSLKVTRAAANAGDFELIDPQGDVAGVGSVAAAFAGGGLSFTLADGATDFVVNDSFAITVAAGNGKYVAYTTTATDGSAVPAAILWSSVDATLTDKTSTAIVRSAEVNGSELVWDASLNAGAIAAATVLLGNLGIIAR